mmetsp:Transcript_62438/g.136508  ORF Transcript_62438/g.136508 Transcript_62438/m.136508 type:complete len:86 (+) Transcript_62438:1024-1281(+)
MAIPQLSSSRKNMPLERAARETVKPGQTLSNSSNTSAMERSLTEEMRASTRKKAVVRRSIRVESRFFRSDAVAAAMVRIDTQNKR